MSGNAQTFTFTAKLVDAVSVTSRQIAGSVQTTATVLRSLEIQASSTFKAIESGGQRTGGAFDLLIPKAKTVLSLIAAIGTAAVFSFHQLDKFADKSLERYGSRESQIRSYEQLFKDKGEARYEYGRGLQIGQETNLTSAQVLAAQRQLATAGLRGAPAHDLLSGILDLSTAAPDEERQSVLKRSAYAIKEIQTMGKLRSRQLNFQLGTAGLDVGLVHQAIAEGRGFQADKNSKLSVRDQQSEFVEKLLKHGNIRSDEGLKAIATALSRQFNDGGKLGGFAKNQAGTIANLQSNRAEALENLQKSFDADILPAVKRYKDALKESAALMSTNTKEGQNLRTVLADISNTGIGLKTIFENFTSGFVESFGESYVNALKDMGVTTIGMENSLTNASAAAKDFGNAIGKVGGVVAWVVHQFDKLSKVGNVATHALKADAAFLRGDFKGYAKEVSAAVLAARTPSTDNQETAAQARARVQKELDDFAYAQAGNKGGGVTPGGRAPVKGIAVAPTAIGGGHPGSGGDAGGGHGGGSGSGGGSGGGVYRSGGMKIGTLHVEVHLGHGDWGAQKETIRQEMPGVLKESLEKAITEMGL